MVVDLHRSSKQQSGVHPDFERISFHKADTATYNMHFWGPDRWHCLIKGIWHVPILQAQIGQADAMGDKQSLKQLVQVGLHK